MKENGIISGPEAIDEIRRLKIVTGSSFGIRFITCDLNRGTCGETRVYDECRIRTARRSEGLAINSDHYLYFTDLKTDEPRQCFKWLIRAVCFPPSNEWLEVKWFI